MTEVKGCGTCKKCFIHIGENPIMAKENKEAQTHTVHTDALGTIGMILPEKAGRDAIHIAVEPVFAGVTLYPGQHIGIDKDYKAFPSGVDLIGIVDPFLTAPVYPGQKFWLLVYPRTITSLRHVWEHPAFPDPITERIVEKEVIREVEVIKEVPVVSYAIDETYEQVLLWLINWCDTNDSPSFDKLLKAFENEGEWVRESEEENEHDDYYSIRVDGEYIHVNGWDAHGDIPMEFYDRLEIVLGKRVRNRPKYFSCSC